MKKIVFMIIVSTLLLNVVKAQHKPFLFGFRVAPNMGWMKTDLQDYKNEGMEFGFSWGFMADFFLMENYSINTGFDVLYLNSHLSYPHQMEINDEMETGRLDRKYRLKYVEVPLTFRMKTNPFGKFILYGEFGGGAAFRISAKSKDEFNSGGSLQLTEEPKIEDETKLFRGSIILGAGVEYFISGSTSLLLSIRFDNGFTDVLKDQNTVDDSVDHHAISNFLEFNIGMLF